MTTFHTEPQYRKEGQTADVNATAGRRFVEASRADLREQKGLGGRDLRALAGDPAPIDRKWMAGHKGRRVGQQP